MPSATFLHTNDFHGKMADRHVEFIRAHRTEGDLYFDCGDCIRAGNLAIPWGRDSAWHFLNLAGCDASVLGNRETHLMESAFERKIEGASHPILVANLRKKEGELVFRESMIFERRGLKIGVFGVMVAMVTAQMASAAASRFLWDPPIPVACQVAESLRPQCDMVVALTHIGYAQDRKLAEMGPAIDLILGGHSHTVLPQLASVGKTVIGQTGSHGRALGKIEWDGDQWTSELLPFPS